MKKVLLYWILLYFYSFAIFYYSSNAEPGKGLGIQPLINTYSFYIHVIEYFIFTILAYLAFTNTNLLKKNIIFSTILFVTLFSISDEIHQLFVPGRYFSIIDMITNTLSSFLFFSIKTIYK